MKSIRRIAFFSIACIVLLPLHGCRRDITPDFSSINAICELATLECYYHNVAVYETDAKKFIITYGNKKTWIEYYGTVKLGIDASKVEVSKPDSNDVITVTLPAAEVLSVNVDANSIERELVENGTFAEITIEDKTKALAVAQMRMEEITKMDENLLNQAQQRAKYMIEKFIQNIGELSEKTYKIVWQYIE